MADHGESLEQAIYRSIYGGIYPEPQRAPEPNVGPTLPMQPVEGTDVNWNEKAPERIQEQEKK